MERKEELKILRKRPMCWLAVGFLLIICIFFLGRSYQDVLYREEAGYVYLEGKIVDKQYKDSGYGAYWQITLKQVRVLKEEDAKVFGWKSDYGEVTVEAGGERKIKSLEGKYLCVLTDSKEVEPKIGQQILLWGKYTPWEEPTNPGQFDSERYYCSQGILGQFRKCNVIKRGRAYSKFKEGLWNLRQQTTLFFRQELGEDNGSLVAAMLLGEKNGLNEEDKSLYQRNGISHILAISGLHVMLLGMGVFRFLKMILGGNKRAAVISIIIMSIYCVFTGNSISTIRATIMFALSLTAQLLGRSYDSLSALGLAAIIQLFINPYVLNNSGFLLSFLAVIGVTFVAPRLQELLGVKRKIWNSICVSISSSMATLPVLLCNYGMYPWYSVFLNLFILPAMSVLLFLAVVLVGTKASVATIGIKFILKYFEICCSIFEHSPLQDGYLGAPNVVQIVIYGMLVIVAISGVIRHSLFMRKMILLAAFMVLTLRFNLCTEIIMLDVGQGDSIVIRNQNGNVYISDCGSSSVSKVGKYRLLPYLKYKGYGRIKGIFISHLDQDHMNGIMELLEIAPEERIKIEYLFLPESVLRIEEDKELLEELQIQALKNKVKIVYLSQGKRIKDGSIEFFCLHPEGRNAQNLISERSDTENVFSESSKEQSVKGESTNNYETLSTEDRNNQSLVLLMKYHDFDMLLTGDVEKEGEREILEDIDQMSLNVLKVAHHGSSGSSDEEFLERLRPKLSLISCGKNNSYGHPHEETLERLDEVGSKIMSTVDSGAITLEIRRNRVIVREYREVVTD